MRLQIASQVPKIKHWRIIEGSWETAPDVVGHWFIDPPYQRAGRSYSYNEIGYDALGRWSRTRKGFVQVCEAGGAKWLRFEPIATPRRYRQGGSQLSVEALFEMEGGEAP